MRHIMDIFKALADENRVRIVMALQGRELCVCQLNELLGLAPSTVSKHMAILRQARLVEFRKEGRWAYYRLAEREATKEAIDSLGWLNLKLRNDPYIVEDRNRLERILQMDPEDLCRARAHGNDVARSGDRPQQLEREQLQQEEKCCAE